MKWKRPTGTIIETSDNKYIRELAKANGWKEVKGRKQKGSASGWDDVEKARELIENPAIKTCG